MGIGFGSFQSGGGNAFLKQNPDKRQGGSPFAFTANKTDNATVGFRPPATNLATGTQALGPSADSQGNRNIRPKTEIPFGSFPVPGAGFTPTTRTASVQSGDELDQFKSAMNAGQFDLTRPQNTEFAPIGGGQVARVRTLGYA